jgi:hypothetical protein
MTIRRLVAIHQPNFFPWLGYFNKIIRSDVFVVLDNVQMSKTGGTWSNRVPLAIGGKSAWITMPIDRSYHGTRLINEIKLQNTPWREKVLRTIKMNYARTPYFTEAFPFISALMECKNETISAFNFNAIKSILMKLNLPIEKLVCASDLHAEGAATDLLIAIIQQVNGNAYMCGGGASGYQEDAKFSAAGIELIYQSFKHPRYYQNTNPEFVEGLSIIDAMMHCGFAGTRALLAESVSPGV